MSDAPSVEFYDSCEAGVSAEKKGGPMPRTAAETRARNRALNEGRLMRADVAAQVGVDPEDGEDVRVPEPDSVPDEPLVDDGPARLFDDT